MRKPSLNWKGMTLEIYIGLFAIYTTGIGTGLVICAYVTKKRLAALEERTDEMEKQIKAYLQGVHNGKRIFTQR